jgi:hypothetical protein
MVLSAETELSIDDVKVDDEFRDLCPKLDASEREQLARNLEAEGCRDALLVWGDDNVLVDGHNRLTICKEKGLHPRIVRIDLSDRAAAINWIIANQLGRRNLNAAQRTYLIGKRQLVEKASHGGARSRSQSDTLKSAERIARESNVSAATVHRAQEFAEAVDRLEDVSPGIRSAVLSGEVRLPRSAVTAAADVPAEQLPAVAAAIRAGRIPEQPGVSSGADVRVLRGALCTVEIDDGTVDVVVVELPWSGNGEFRLEELGLFAARVLRRGGSLLVAVDPRDQDECRAGLANALQFHWSLTRMNPGYAVQMKKGVMSRCSPVLWFVKEEYAGADVLDPLEAPWPGAAVETLAQGGTVCVVGNGDAAGSLSRHGLRVLAVEWSVEALGARLGMSVPAPVPTQEATS